MTGYYLRAAGRTDGGAFEAHTAFRCKYRNETCQMIGSGSPSKTIALPLMKMHHGYRLLVALF